eukprot:11292937-Alexandrium_andersonii.AAC.1
MRARSGRAHESTAGASSAEISRVAQRTRRSTKAEVSDLARAGSTDGTSPAASRMSGAPGSTAGGLA